jgi:signal transduction histidine kinase
MDAGLGGAMRIALSAIEGTALAIGDALAPSIQHLVEGIGHAASQFLNTMVDLANKPDDDATRQVVLSRADDVVQRFLARAQAAGVMLEIDYPDELPLARLDAALVERALTNLLDNALRVTPAQGRVLVRVRFVRGEVRIEVIDTGPGVAPEDQPRVFERFYQASRARDQRGASGLGLAIVKRVAELHGGRAGLHSEPGRGSTFFIELPTGA